MFESIVVIWDIQTGVIINHFNIDTPYPVDKIAFCGNQTIVFKSTDETFRTYDVLEGVQLSEEVLTPRTDDWLIHWSHGDSVLVATSFDIDGKTTINIRDLQPTSSPPFPVVQSFSLPPYNGIFSFSPVSFHASFLDTQEAVILNVRDLEVLLRIDTTTGKYDDESGCFSPDGRFFAYMMKADEIRVWKNTSTGYVPWSNFVPQFTGLLGFAFSPSAISILSWGDYGIELLDNHLRPPSPKNTMHHRRTETHLVACSADGTHIATARSLEGVVTILDPLLDTPQRHINTNMRILEIKIFDNVLFVADGHKLVSWDLGVGGTGRDAHGVRRVTLDGKLGTGWFELSNNCSQIAVLTEKKVSLYDTKTQEILNECTMENMGQDFLRWCTTSDIWDVQFSPDGRQLWLIYERFYRPRYCATLHTTKDWRSAGATWEFLEDGWSQDSPFPPGYRIRVGSGWVEGPGGRKLLWLPPNWRTEQMFDAIWDGNFLALVNGRHPEPMIIEFRPQPLLPHSCSTHSSNP